MKWIVQHKWSVAIFAVVVMMVAGAIVVSRCRIGALPPFPDSARNMVSAVSATATEIVKESFGVGVAGDGALPEGETIVVDNGGNENATATNGSDGDGSVPSPSFLPAPEYLPPKQSMDPEPQPIVAVADVSAPSSSENISCQFPSAFPASSSLSGKIIFNEIAWMGSPSSSPPAGASGSNAEWMELKNDSSETIALSDWEVEDVSGKIAVRFAEDEKIRPGGFLLLERGSTTFPYAHAAEVSYSGTMKNTGDDLVLFDPSCSISDYVVAAEGWPAGDNAAKKTMERDDDGKGWHTSAAPGGTPGAENSVLVAPAQYKVVVVFSGTGGASVASDPAGVACTTGQCTGLFAAGTSVALTAKPAAGAIFGGWSGACSGKGSCAFTVEGPTDVTAMFSVPIPIAMPESKGIQTDKTISDPDVSESPTQHPSSSSPLPQDTGVRKIFIAAVQIAGAASSNDYVKLYNPTTVPVDVGGWKLKKRSSTGAEYSLRTMPDGDAIGAGGYFVWANSKDGFADSLGADVSSTETLSADNSVALIDAGGSVVDALAWGAGAGQYGEGEAFSVDPAAGQVLARKADGNAMVDTGNNAADFVLE